MSRPRAYDMTTDFEPKGDGYDMYSDNRSFKVGPCTVHVCEHEEGRHMVICDTETGEHIAETDITPHELEHHVQAVIEGMDDLVHAHNSMQKAEKPFHGYNSKKHSKTGGLNDSYRKKVNREEGSNLKRPVTGKVKPGSKAAGRRKSFCARMSGVKGPTSKDGKLTPKGAALKRWKCSKSEEMNKSHQLKSFMAKVDGKRSLEHYSNQENLTHIDPKFQGSGIDSRTKGRSTEHPHSFYYRPGAVKEDLVTQHAKNKYVVEIPEEASLYDISQDPDQHAKAVRDANNGAFNMDEMHARIKGAGHHGFYASNHPNEEMRGVVALYHAQPVVSSESLGKNQSPKKYVNVSQHWTSKIYDHDKKDYTNPVRDAGKSKPEHMDDLHALKQAGHISGWTEHDHPKKSFGNETYEVSHDGKLKHVGSHYDSGD